MKFSIFKILVTLCLVFAFGSPLRKMRSRRPTKSRIQMVIPNVNCADLFKASIDIGDEGPLIRKTQHHEDCKKYFECVTNHWLSRDCPDGTTFNLEDKNCDLTKSCKPSLVKELYVEGIDKLKSFMEHGEPKKF